MEPLIKGSTDDKRANLEIWNEQKRLADEYCWFLKTAIERGFKIEVAIIVDGEVCKSTIMPNYKYDGGNVVLRELLRAAVWECQKIDAMIYRLKNPSENGQPGKSP